MWMLVVNTQIFTNFPPPYTWGMGGGGAWGAQKVIQGNLK